ncbi:ATP-binding protein [Paracoccus sp. p4-l81]|uniref:sensor histidine kinase n=1 Tax=unclassified Paracoccus (in: a-proteobacteria) TaxID=2688777 RepID=UPI0035B6FA70
MTGLRVRLTVAAAALALLAMLAAGGAVLALTRADHWNAQADAAQARIEAYSALSARITARVLARDAAADEAMAGVGIGLAALDGLIRADLAAAPDLARTEAAARAARDLALIRGLVDRMDQGLREAGDDTAARDAALNAFGAAYAPVIDQQINAARVRRDGALAAAQDWARRSLWLAIAIALAAPVVLAAVYAGVIRPLIRRIGAASGAVAAGRLPVTARDELGLLFARINRVTAGLDRRRARVEADRRDLQTLIAARTADLQAAHDRLAQIDADRRRFFADVGHELRTPLTVILAETELARTDDPDLAAALSVIRTRAARLNRRIDDMLRVARSDSGVLDLDHAPVDLAAMARLAVDDMAPLLRRAGIDPVLDLQPGLVVAGDGDWLRQVLSGLIDNAVKYAGNGAQVTLTTRASGAGHAALVLTDDGPGLPDAAVPGRFRRGDAGGSGFGVGLALAGWVAREHGGSLDLGRGPDGRGLAVTLSLPLVAAGERRVA